MGRNTAIEVSVDDVIGPLTSFVPFTAAVTESSLSS